MSRGVPFAPGNKLGRGRPKGSRNKGGQDLPKILAECAEPLMRKCIAMALRENPHAMRLCMDRVQPVRSAPPVRFRLPDLDTATGLGQAVTRLLQAVARGQLTPAEAKELAVLVESKRRILETRELEERIRNLESHVPKARE